MVVKQPLSAVKHLPPQTRYHIANKLRAQEGDKPNKMNHDKRNVFLILVGILVSTTSGDSPAAVVAAGLNKLYSEPFSLWGQTVAAAVKDSM